MVHGHKGLDESDRYSGEHSWEIYSTAGSLEDSSYGSDRHGNTSEWLFHLKRGIPAIAWK